MLPDMKGTPPFLDVQIAFRTLPGDESELGSLLQAALEKEDWEQHQMPGIPHAWFILVDF